MTSPIAFNVRRAVPDDAAAIAAVLAVIANERIHSAIDRAWTADEERQYIASLSEREAIHVACHPVCGVVGCQCLDLWSPLSSMAHVGQAGTFLLPEWRGLGIGRKLWSATESFAREAGYRKLVIQVRGSNAAAQAFYRGLGFSECGRLARQVLIDGVEDDEVIMEYFIMPTNTDLEFTEVQVAPTVAIQMSGQCAPDPPSIAEAIGKGFAAVMDFAARHGLTPGGPPRTIYTSYDPGGVSFILAAPVTAGPAAPADESPILVDTLPAARTYRFTHRGPYPDLMRTYNQIAAFLKEKGMMASEADWARYMPMWEEYINDPETTPEADLVTYIHLPVS